MSKKPRVKIINHVAKDADWDRQLDIRTQNLRNALSRDLRYLRSFCDTHLGEAAAAKYRDAVAKIREVAV
jgi:hypothetical protein